MPTIDKMRIGSTDYELKDAKALHLPTAAPTAVSLIGVDTAKAQTNVAVGEGLKIENGTLKTNGVATLGSDGKVPTAQLPSYVDDVLEYASKSAFPATGESGKIYVAKDTNLTYRWSGTQYTEISQSLALGETAQTAYAGDKGKQNADNIAALTTRVATLEEGGTGTSASAIPTATVDAIAQEVFGV